jgi:hypothetical protein
MRPLALAAAVVVAVAAGCATAPPAPPPPPPDPGAAYGTFETSLAPYGGWIVVGGYGRVWRPRVAATWQPYLYGEWVWTEDGWLWVTEEPWGWATYHYGRWGHDPSLGWFWVPGSVWGPAWVAWRSGDGWVGWAPLVPDVDVWWTDAYPLGPQLWVFVPARSFVGVRVDAIAVPRARAPGLWRATRPAPPRRVERDAPPHGGPPRPWVERATGRPVSPVRVVPAPSPADARRGVERGAVPVYRPAPGARPPPARTGPGATSAPPPRADERGRGEPATAPAPSPAPRGDDRGRGVPDAAPPQRPAEPARERAAPEERRPAPPRAAPRDDERESGPARPDDGDRPAPPPRRGDAR